MENTVELFGICCITLVSLVVVSSTGGNSRIASKAIEVLKSAVDAINGKVNKS